MKRDTKAYLIAQQLINEAKELDTLREKKAKIVTLLDKGNVRNVTVTPEFIENFEKEILNELKSLDEKTRQAVMNYIEKFSTEADNEKENFTGILSCSPKEQKNACILIQRLESEMESTMGDN